MEDSIPTEAQLAASVTPSYRRNGKLFSCEPCRRGKLRCDHNNPVCGRCARRGKPDQCIYHPAPLTKPRNSPGPGPQGTSKPSSRASTVAPYPSAAPERLQSGLISPPASNETQQQGPIRQLDRGSSDHQSATRPLGVHSVIPSPVEERIGSSAVSYNSPESGMSFREGKVGFLGPTSYSAIFTENSSSLGIVEQDEVDDRALPPVTVDKIKQGAEVLALLKDMPLYERFTQRFHEMCDGKHCLPCERSLLVINSKYRFQALSSPALPIVSGWMTFGQNLGISFSEADLRSFSVCQKWCGAIKDERLKYKVILRPVPGRKVPQGEVFGGRLLALF